MMEYLLFLIEYRRTDYIGLVEENSKRKNVFLHWIILVARFGAKLTVL
jgi:hypothetical protein